MNRLFKSPFRTGRLITWGDAIALLVIFLLLYFGVRLAFGVPGIIAGPQISLSPRALPRYAALSLARMGVAYLLSMLFTLIYGRLAAYNRRAELFLMPLLDVLQSVPILSFLPVVLLSFSAIFPVGLAAELASIVLIFTSQAWNLTFAWYQSLRTIPVELREASAIFRLNGWMRFRQLELPFAAGSLVWNSMVSWAGGWFFLMAAEIFTVGQRDFRLPGIGAYLQEAANQGNFQAIAWGILTLVLLIVLMDQLVWRPLLAWSERFRIGAPQDDKEPTSWFYNALRSSRLLGWFGSSIFSPLQEHIDTILLRRYPVREDNPSMKSKNDWIMRAVTIPFAIGLAYGLYLGVSMLLHVSPAQWMSIWVGIGATFLRVIIAMGVAMIWTLPIGVAIGTNPRLAASLQPLVQITASVPATALFPILLLLFLHLPSGLNFAAVLLMLLGAQWYLLFNIIAGASAIPQDLKYTSELMHLSSWGRWRNLVLPAMFPFLVTGAITASGGAWNASIVAERVEFSGQTLATVGIGALIAQATANGDYPLLLAGTLCMILTVVAINRLFWHRLYILAEEKYRME